ncbi:flavodoxin [Bacteroides sp.]|uniref:flavodoxin n=1 Tax=Bacteroides sp. TaxID=29523 RepID=UPI0026124136|nr:flavodoxin [Bacteroides sp.]MDD3040848.1 flavodoxin [Bacteroides sp.]
MAVVMVALLLCLLSGCGMGTSFCASKQDEQRPSADTARKILIVYYSRSGDTRELAQVIQENVGGDLLELQTVEPYPKEDEKIAEQAKPEITQGIKAILKPIIYDVKDYDLIFVGYPIWRGTIAPPVTSFLIQNDFTNKTLIPFCTHGGNGEVNSVSDIQKLLPRALVLNGFAANGSNVENEKQNIINWLSKIQIGE